MLKKSLVFTGIALALTFGLTAMADSYTLDTCPISGEKLDGDMGDAIVKEYDGREVRFCCKSCVKKFEKDKKAGFEKVDLAIAKQQKGYYPLDTCIVSGKKLDSKGDPVEFVHNNRLVRFCCSGCVKPFGKDPAKFLGKLDEAVIEKQAKNYPVTTCVVKGEDLDGDAINHVLGNRLVKLCCKGCVKKVNAEPAKYLAMLDKAAGTATAGSSEAEHEALGENHHAEGSAHK